MCIRDSFDKVVQKDDATMKEISTMAVKSMFNDFEIDGFASQFIQTQLIGGIGVKGLDGAKKTLHNTLDNRPFYQKLPGIDEKIENKAVPAFFEVWNYNGIKKYLTWETLPEKKRSELTQAVLNLNILPRLDSTLSENEIDKKNHLLTKKVTEHVYSYHAHKNKYLNKNAKGRMKRSNMNKKFKITFPELMAQDITETIKEDVLDDIKKQLSF